MKISQDIIPVTVDEIVMDIHLPEKTSSIQSHNGRFLPGHSGNPAGRPKGSLNKTTRAAIELLDGAAEAITAKCIELALAGDIVAIKLCLDRLIPPRREMPDQSVEQPERDITAEVIRIFCAANSRTELAR